MNPRAIFAVLDPIFYALFGLMVFLGVALITRDTIRELMGKKPIKKGRFVRMILS